jgi:hypothetical protein
MIEPAVRKGQDSEIYARLATDDFLVLCAISHWTKAMDKRIERIEAALRRVEEHLTTSK